ncbi:hypothetical protein DENIS_4111 [Desulfonema ishimotonii]|uniref:Uncharacterized protein n=1 Tax=Desulfonema ishimotonii TaxID=45657 RepID=A0A401G1M6_9BACT|nr:hypothetical protein DENIS_4111 [Desulfonema ishimotonii]
MFAGLGHHTLIGGNDHGHDINSGGPGNHVLDKFFMAGHIDDADMLSARQVKGCKPEFNGDAPFLLLL